VQVSVPVGGITGLLKRPEFVS